MTPQPTPERAIPLITVTPNDGRSRSGSATRSPWSVTTVIIVGLVLICAATVGAIIRDLVYLSMVEARQEAVLKSHQETLRGQRQ
jgi:hypothetical protein